jgi:hypothetical protein
LASDFGQAPELIARKAERTQAGRKTSELTPTGSETTKEKIALLGGKIFLINFPARETIAQYGWHAYCYQ